MKLVAAPDGSVNQIDRALWVSLGFDISFATSSEIVSSLSLAAIAGMFWPLSAGSVIAGMGAAKLSSPVLSGVTVSRLPQSAEAGSASSELPGHVVTGRGGV